VPEISLAVEPITLLGAAHPKFDIALKAHLADLEVLRRIPGFIEESQILGKSATGIIEDELHHG
jgi:hypothetical protein